MDKKYLDFLGITKWHDEGYRGKGIKILSEENVDADAYRNVTCPFGKKSKSGHGNTIMELIQDVTPYSTFYAFTIGGAEKAGEFQSEQIDYIKKNNIDIITTSSLGQALNGSGARKVLQELVENNVALICSAGNKGNDGLDDMAKNEEWLSIGGCYLTNNKPKLANYSSIGEELDFVSLMGGYEGTSFAAPIFAGMVALVQGFFLEKIGRKLHYLELIDFIKSNCKDLYEEGFDFKTGHGLFILPDPNQIDYEKYRGGTNMKIFIDAGHNYSTCDTGASGHGLKEQNITYQIANGIRQILADYDCEVKLSRDKLEANLGDTVDISLFKRTDMANRWKANLFISIHCNSSANEKAEGTETYIYDERSSANELANNINNAICTAAKTQNRGVKISKNLAVLKNTMMPAMLVEVGFISNEYDANIFKNNCNVFAETIAAEIIKYYKLEKTVKNTGEDVHLYRNLYAFYINGNKVDINSVLIDNNNYIKLRDIVTALGGTIEKVDGKTVYIKR